MFLAYPSIPAYMTAKTKIPEKYDGLYYSSSPVSETGDRCGVGLVAQYIESYRFKTYGVCRISAGCLDKVHAKAIELDEADNAIDMPSEKYPTMTNVMNAFIQLGYVKNVDGLGYVRPVQNDMKYFIRQYGGILVQVKLTDKTHNAYQYDIFDTGTQTNFDFVKGFIAFGYDNAYVYLQNSLGAACGSLGFHRVPWNVMANLAVCGMVFRLDNPS